MSLLKLLEIVIFVYEIPQNQRFDESYVLDMQNLIFAKFIKFCIM